jgi:hypothetical protein
VEENGEKRMKAGFRPMPRGQQGSFYSTAIIVVMFGVFLTTALKIAPAYMDNNVVTNAMESVAANNNLKEMSQADIRASVMKTLNVNNVALDSNAIKVVQEGSAEFVVISYEARVPLFYNISAIVAFDNRFEKN